MLPKSPNAQDAFRPMQTPQLSRIARETHAFGTQLTLTRIGTLFSRISAPPRFVRSYSHALQSGAASTEGPHAHTVIPRTENGPALAHVRYPVT